MDGCGFWLYILLAYLVGYIVGAFVEYNREK
jgi:hypothetical protein